jgi:hypothetical protein
MKRRWNSSDEAARELKTELFGTPNHIRTIARIQKHSETYAETRKIVNNLVDIPMTSRSGLIAALSRNSIDKLLSGKSVAESFTYKAHLLAVCNLDTLYTNAIEPWLFELNPGKNNGSLLSVRRLFAPMEYNGRIVIVKITVKELKNDRDGNRIYSLKVLDVVLEQKK